MPRRSFPQALGLVGLILVLTPVDRAQTAGRRALITQAIDDTKLVTLAGNTRPEATSRNDRGAVPNDMALDMYLQLKRSPEQDRAAAQFLESLTDKTSPNFHKWITAAEYGQRFGAASEDIATVTRWLESHGFTVNGVPVNNMVIDFSGTAGQVRDALHTEIHTLEVSGKRYFANMSDPQIPAALLPAVTGVVSLNNFMPHPMFVPRSQYTVSARNIPVVPGDLATIYNLNPAFAGGFTGQGQTVVVVEDTDLYNNSGDWSAFRNTFGLAQYASASLTQVHPAPGKGGTACEDPGVNGDDSEAAIDVEWASAAAPNAAIVMASCADTTNFGGFIALQNLLTNGGPLPGIVSISYGESETDSGASFNSYISILYQTAAAAGVSVFVSSGDAGAVATDRGSEVAIHGVTVSSFASTVYNVAVGGTDFGDTAAGTTSTFFSSSNGIYYNSAKSYVPEIPWNDSCGSALLARYQGFITTYGTAGYCNATYDGLTMVGGSGGPSGCATGAPALKGVVSGTCAGNPKPSWQSIAGNPSDGVRDLPDLSLFAANGVWSHYYVFCISDGASCSGPPSTWAGAGGTSFGSPIMAGIQALINQALGTTKVGNPNPVYYQIGQSEYSGANTTSCNSTTGPASTCSFNDVTEGDIVVPCAGAYNCFFGGGGLGVLSTSDTSYEPAYGTSSGWDFATGIGSVNAYNLLSAFVNSIAPSLAPAAPVLVSPANGATGVSTETTLSWNASAGAKSYDVYLGTAMPPPLIANTANLNYAPDTLSAGTAYYWAVGARNSIGANISAVSPFTTSCVLALNPPGATVGADGGMFTIPVTASSGCSWTAVSNAPWITITSGTPGSGNGTVGYTAAVDTVADRIGTITIAGQTFTVTQLIYPLISTVAGGALPPTSAPGTLLSIPVSYGVAVDSSGNSYFSSPNLNAVFKADPTGVVTRIAGSGLPGFSGDNGPALNAELDGPQAVAVDASGNVFIADSENLRIRKVGVTGTITTVAGNGDCCGYTGDGGPATSAQIGFPYGVAVDSSGNLYIPDADNNVIRKVATSGIIATVAGDGSYGYLGDGGSAIKAEFRDPFGVAVDSSGNLYIADRYNLRVRMISTSGTISTVAGNGNCCHGGDGGTATSAQLGYPSGVAVDAAGDLYIADTDNSRIRKVNAAGIITTVAGNGNQGFSGDGVAATSAELDLPGAVAVDVEGNLYIADSTNERIRSVSAAGTIATLVGGAIGDGGPGVFGYLNQPSGVARDNAGNTYIADTNNNRVRTVAANGTITTIAGTGAAGFAGDNGPAPSAQLNGPQGMAVDASGNLYIADSNNRRVRKIDATGVISTVAGSGICCGYTGDGAAATGAQIGTPYGLAVDSSGNLYISDISNNVVRKVSSSGIINTVAGNGTYGYSGDGGAAAGAEFRDPVGVAVDSSGNLYIADAGNLRVRMVSASGIVTTVAGNGNCCYGGDGGPATSAQLAYPDGVAVDGAGDLYIADTENNRVREVVPGGNIITAAGNGDNGNSGDGGPGNGATFWYPYGVSVDAAGNVAVVDRNNNAIRLLTPPGTRPVLSLQSTHAGSFAQGQTGAVYTLTVTNGPGAAPTSAMSTVTEILPAGLTLVSMTGAGWTCGTAPACTRSDSLSAGASYPAITVTVNVSATAPVQLTNEASVTGGGAATAGRATDLTVIAPPSPPAAPSITPGGVVPVFSTVATIQPGEWVSIYGSNLAGSTVHSSGNFPVSLGGTSVTINGKPAYLLYVSPQQIDLQTPDDSTTGPVLVVVSNGSGSAASTVTLAQFAPSFPLLDTKHAAGIILRPDGSGAYGGGAYDILGPTGSSLGYPTVAAKAGDIVELFGFGFGPTTPGVPAGLVFTGAAPTANPVNILINNTSVTPGFAGLSSAGVYQFNITVPAGSGTGDVPLVATVGGSRTPPGVVISLQ